MNFNAAQVGGMVRGKYTKSGEENQGDVPEHTVELPPGMSYTGAEGDDAMQVRKEMIVVGDRILLQIDETQDKTKSGLYLPPSVREREKVAMGKVVKVGPGYPIPNPNYTEDEPWSPPKDPMRYIPLQAKDGDYAIFMREQAIEVEFEESKYLIVSQSAVLMLVRNRMIED